MCNLLNYVLMIYMTNFEPYIQNNFELKWS